MSDKINDEQDDIFIKNLLNSLSIEEKENFKSLSQVIELQQKAYELLKWLDKAMYKGFISAKNAHNNMSMSEASKAWLLQHVLNIPNNARPDVSNEEELDIFCNLFSSFLNISFDIAENPGQMLFSEYAHCFCSMCSYFINMSHLRPKKIGKVEKKKAKNMKYNFLLQLCLDEHINISETKLKEIAESNEYGESVAMLTYAKQLMRRSKGLSHGPAVLALWREFAWGKTGSPKKNFEFSASLVLNAKFKIMNQLNGRFLKKSF